jgi:hypothetical protein
MSFSTTTTDNSIINHWIKPYYEAFPQDFHAVNNWPRQLLRIHEWADETITPKLARMAIKSKTQPNLFYPVKQQGLKLFDFIVRKLTDFDFREFPKVEFPGLSKLIGPVPFAEIPIAGILTLLYLAVIPKRLEMAHRRERPDELTKEANDVWIRDMTSFFFLALALKPATRWFNATVMQRGAGLPLVNNGGIIPYSDMAEIYTLKSPQDLQLLATNPKTQIGFAKALQSLSDKGLSALGDIRLNTALDNFKSLVNTALKTPEQLEGFSLAFQQLKGLDALVKKASQKGIDQLAVGVNQKQAKALVARAASIAKDFKYTDFLVHHAKAFRLPGDVASLAVTCIMAGWAPLALNDWFSRRAIGQFKKTHPTSVDVLSVPLAIDNEHLPMPGQPITPVFSNPFSGTPPTPQVRLAQSNPFKAFA